MTLPLPSLPVVHPDRLTLGVGHAVFLHFGTYLGLNQVPDWMVDVCPQSLPLLILGKQLVFPHIHSSRPTDLILALDDDFSKPPSL